MKKNIAIGLLSLVLSILIGGSLSLQDSLDIEKRFSNSMWNAYTNKTAELASTTAAFDSYKKTAEAEKTKLASLQKTTLANSQALSKTNKENQEVTNFLGTFTTQVLCSLYPKAAGIMVNPVQKGNEVISDLSFGCEKTAERSGIVPIFTN